MGRKTQDQIQFAALPYRVGTNGQVQILVLTSRETKRWVIPKGWPIKGLKPRHVAAREAYEEAGVQGTIAGKRPIGVYHYEKRLSGEQLLSEVHVFLLRVAQQLDDWPEKGQRESRWVDVTEATALVDEGGLAELVRSVFTASRPQRPPRCACPYREIVASGTASLAFKVGPVRARPPHRALWPHRRVAM